jgi:ubiquinone/menaquinone biosynthesis C-methylase UbiE
MAHKILPGKPYPLSAPDVVLEEIHRVLRSNGILSFSDHHMKDEIVSKVTNTGLFNLSTEGEMTHTFSKHRI